MKYICHGMSMLAWMIEFDSDLDIEKDKVDLWNEAANLTSEVESRVMEQTNRVNLIHPAEVRCQICPVPAQPAITPKPVHPPDSPPDP